MIENKDNVGLKMDSVKIIPIEIQGKYTTAKIMIDNVEPECIAKIYMFVNHEAFTNMIVIMPDTHDGKGSVIGFTMPITNKVIPNVIGVDIGCGMTSARLKGVVGDLKDLDAKIRAKIPTGFNVHKTAKPIDKKVFIRAQEVARKFMNSYLEKFGIDLSEYYVYYDEKWLQEKCDQIGENYTTVLKSIGTLGGGNHFIEIGKDENEKNWVTVHSGSRHFGYMICSYWQKQAIDNHKYSHDELQKKIAKIREEAVTSEQKREINSKIKKLREDMTYKGKKDLAYLNNPYGYLFDMIFAQVYAEANRQKMLESIMDVLEETPTEIITSTHNYIDFDDLIIRKGAIRSYKGERMVIPFNMRDGLLICEGLSNKEWNNSAPHGAGRVLSRSKAKATLSMEEFKKQMANVFSTSVCQSTLDEAPEAYKNSAIIEKAIAPTCEIIHRVKPILNIKAL